jgi:hypothetical protein
MAYIGREPAYGSFEKQALTADSSTTTFSLNYTVGSSSSILVSVAGVHQEPEVAYNLASGGTQIVFTAAPTTGDTVFVIFLGIAYDAGELLSTGTITNKTEETTVANDDLKNFNLRYICTSCFEKNDKSKLFSSSFINICNKKLHRRCCYS